MTKKIIQATHSLQHLVLPKRRPATRGGNRAHHLASIRKTNIS